MRCLSSVSHSLRLMRERSDDSSKIDIDAFIWLSMAMMRDATSASECVVLHFTTTNVPRVSPSTVMYSRLVDVQATMPSSATKIAAISSLCSFEKAITYVYIRTAKIVKISKFLPYVPLKNRLIVKNRKIGVILVN